MGEFSLSPESCTSVQCGSRVSVSVPEVVVNAQQARGRRSPPATHVAQELPHPYSTTECLEYHSYPKRNASTPKDWKNTSYVPSPRSTDVEREDHTKQEGSLACPAQETPLSVPSLAVAQLTHAGAVHRGGSKSGPPRHAPPPRFLVQDSLQDNTIMKQHTCTMLEERKGVGLKKERDAWRPGYLSLSSNRPRMPLGGSGTVVRSALAAMAASSPHSMPTREPTLRAVASPSLSRVPTHALAPQSPSFHGPAELAYQPFSFSCVSSMRHQREASLQSREKRLHTSRSAPQSFLFSPPSYAPAEEGTLTTAAYAVVAHSKRDKEVRHHPFPPASDGRGRVGASIVRTGVVEVKPAWEERQERVVRAPERDPSSPPPLPPSRTCHLPPKEKQMQPTEGGEADVLCTACVNPSRSPRVVACPTCSDSVFRCPVPSMACISSSSSSSASPCLTTGTPLASAPPPSEPREGSCGRPKRVQWWDRAKKSFNDHEETGAMSTEEVQSRDLPTGKVEPHLHGEEKGTSPPCTSSAAIFCSSPATSSASSSSPVDPAAVFSPGAASLPTGTVTCTTTPPAGPTPPSLSLCIPLPLLWLEGKGIAESASSSLRVVERGNPMGYPFLLPAAVLPWHVMSNQRSDKGISHSPFFMAVEEKGDEDDHSVPVTYSLPIGTSAPSGHGDASSYRPPCGDTVVCCDDGGDGTLLSTSLDVPRAHAEQPSISVCSKEQRSSSMPLPAAPHALEEEKEDTAMHSIPVNVSSSVGTRVDGFSWAEDSPPPIDPWLRSSLVIPPHSCISLVRGLYGNLVGKKPPPMSAYGSC